MQKTVFSLCLLVLCVLISCNNNNNVQPLCTTLESNSVWTAENFKTGYTIQFPPTYVGDGSAEDSSYYFDKYNANSDVRFFWRHCGVAFCDEYGLVPLTTFRDTITVPSSEIFNTGGYVVRNDLTEYKLLCDSNGIGAVFYYNTLPDADGALFLKLDDDQHYAAVLMNYKSTAQQEVEDILKTIQPGSVAPPGND